VLRCAADVGADDPRIAPLPAGPHLGVMTYFFVVYRDLL
jgi:hypothetical protein